MIELIYPMYVVGFPSKMANVLQRINTSHALASTGKVNIHLIYPAYKYTSPEEILKYYDLELVDGLFFHPILCPRSASRKDLIARGYQRAGILAICIWLMVRSRGLQKRVILYGREIEYLHQLLPIAHAINIPVVFESHGITSDIIGDGSSCIGKKTVANSSAREKLARQEKKFFSNVDFIIATTYNLQSVFINRFGINENKLAVIPNGVSSKELLKVGQTKLCRDDASRGNQPSFKVVYTGNSFTPKYGLEQLIQAMTYLGQDYELIFVGGRSPENVEWLCNEAKRLNVLEKVRFVGHVDSTEVVKWQQYADLLVLCFRQGDVEIDNYMSPIKMFEYMASGKPILAPDLTMLREIIQHNVNAWLHEPNNPKSLAIAIQHLRANPDLAQRLASRAKKDVEEHYTWERRAEKVLDVLNLRLWI